MKKVASLDYKIDNSKTDVYGQIVVGVIVIGIFLFLFTRTIEMGLLILLIILIVLRLYFIPAGRLEFYYENGNFYCRNKIRNKEASKKLRIKEKKFRWSYNFLGISGGTGGDGDYKESAVNFPLLRLEMELEDGEKVIVCHELGQWSSTPHWKYEIFTGIENDELVVLTSSKLRKLKTEMEKIEITFE